MGLEQYTRVKQLGQGSFGKVFLVQDKRDGQQYVMKEVDLAQFGPKGRKEALKEVGFLNAMSHPFIVAYREFFEQDPTGTGRKMLYIVMEYASGGDLDGRIKAQNGRPFPEALVLEWFVQVCLAVKHIHDRKIIHRDLKAENIFLMRSTATSAGQVKLGDFGISKSMAHTMAQAITRIGTPYYLSPEICMNKPYNAKSDLWSLGVILYEMMSLKHPFDATSMEGLLNKIVKTQPPPLPKQYSIELRTIVDSLLSKQPAKRPTVNSLLKLPFLAPYVQRMLSPAQLQDEFSHTVLHSAASARQINPPPALPPSNHVAQQRELPGVKAAKPQQHILAHPNHQRQPSQQQQQQPLPPPSAQQRPVYHEQKESVSHRGAPSPFQVVYPAVAPVSHRPPSGRAMPPSSGGVPPSPSPYANMSNADKIRAIREKKEMELREAKQSQMDLARQRQQQQQQQQQYQQPPQAYHQQAPEDTDRDRQQRVREALKERQMAEHARGGAGDYNLPPALRGGRGIPSVSRQDVASTPLHGVPYNDRAAANPTRLQHQAMVDAARKAREDESARLRVRHFQERKRGREVRLKELSHHPQPIASAAPSAYGYPPRQGQVPAPLHPYAQQRSESRWR